MRQLLSVGLPIAVPLALYLLWFAWARRVALERGSEPPRLGDAPWTWLLAAGLALAAAIVAAGALMGGSRPGERYVPPHLKDGAVVPGQSVPGQALPAQPGRAGVDGGAAGR